MRVSVPFFFANVRPKMHEIFLYIIFMHFIKYLNNLSASG